jgi:AcrR family transcriptional regulator
MQEQGVAALNLNEVARRLGISGQALARYFPNKAALYDAIFLMGHRIFREAEEELWQTTKPDWERIQRWFEVRLALARENPDLYALIWGSPVPGYTPSAASLEEIRKILVGARQGIGEVIAAEGIDAGMPPEQVVDILLAVRHGIVAEIMSKRNYLPPDSNRLYSLLSNIEPSKILPVFQKAWTPSQESIQRVAGNRASSEVNQRKGGRSS